MTGPFCIFSAGSAGLLVARGPFAYPAAAELFNGKSALRTHDRVRDVSLTRKVHVLVDRHCNLDCCLVLCSTSKGKAVVRYED